MMEKTLEERIQELEKKVAVLEGQVQAQPLELNIKFDISVAKNFDMKQLEHEFKQAFFQMKAL